MANLEMRVYQEGPGGRCGSAPAHTHSLHPHGALSTGNAFQGTSHVAWALYQPPRGKETERSACLAKVVPEPLPSASLSCFTLSSPTCFTDGNWGIPGVWWQRCQGEWLWNISQEPLSPLLGSFGKCRPDSICWSPSKESRSSQERECGHCTCLLSYLGEAAAMPCISRK